MMRGAAACVHHGDNPQGFFLGCVGNQVFTHKNEPQGARAEVRAPVALMGKRYKPAKGVKNFRDDPIGCVRVILGNLIANIVEVGVGFQVERLAATHAGGCAVLGFSLSGGQGLPHRRWVLPCRFSARHSGC